MGKKQSLLPLLLALCLLLSACGGESSVPRDEVPPSPAEEVARIPEPAGEAEPVPAGEDPEAEPVPVGEDSEAEPSSPGLWTLLERDDLCVRLAVSLDLESGSPRAYLLLSLPNLGSADLMISDLVVNDKLQMSGPYRFTYSRYTMGETTMELPLGELYSTGALRQGEELRFRCRIYLTRWNDADRKYDILWEEPCEALVPAGYQPGFAFVPFMDALAEEQLLLDNGQLRITLLGMGRPVGWDRSELVCLLRVENLSQERIPFDVSGFRVNGVFFTCYADSYQLYPGSQCYPYASVSQYTLDDYEFDSIGDVALRLLTDESDHNGFLLDDGGTWFPVDLRMRGQANAEPDFEHLLYEDELLQIALVDVADRDSAFDEETTYSWRLAIRNLGDQDLELSTSHESEDLDLSFYATVGADSWVYASVYVTVPTGEPRPAVSIPFRVYVNGGGTLLYSASEPLLLPNE